MIYGYCRVSTRDQNEARQIIAMKEYGVEESAIFLDKLSGKDFNRPQYKRIIRKLKPGDVIVIKSIDRLGRNYDEILEQWRYITKEKDADIVVLDMPLLDTRRKEHGLMGKLIADIVLQLLSYVAQNEREAIHQRQAEGIAAAKARGVRFGPKVKQHDTLEYYSCVKWWHSGELSANEAGRILGVGRNTFIHWMQIDGLWDDDSALDGLCENCLTLDQLHVNLKPKPRAKPGPKPKIRPSDEEKAKMAILEIIMGGKSCENNS